MTEQSHLGLIPRTFRGNVPSHAGSAPQMVLPNIYSQHLTGEYDLMDAIQRAGGLQVLACPSAYHYDKPPYLVMPPEGRQYTEVSSIIVPAAGAGDTLVHSFRVPTGYDGVVTSITNFYTGAGFVEGSGSILWRLKIQNRWARNMGEINTTLGSLQSPCPLFRGGIRVFSGQTVYYYVNIPALSGIAGGRTVCGVFGWYYPL